MIRRSILTVVTVAAAAGALLAQSPALIGAQFDVISINRQFAASTESVAQGRGLNNAAIEEALALGRESEPSHTRCT